uniref:Uncharacterized protein n=1 Tax=Amphora coffeiformis TaxID=265554 RepID=A0A7S3P924_9STRA|mmetsp:Transcript_21332/g.40540  ORF Transcript_21332/g.40540 Transcript_21332/m.40540 type:complete len:218 (+) Transcript_21332:190-843(+)
MAMIQALQGLELRTANGEGFAAAVALDSGFTSEGMSDEMLAIALQASLAEEAYIETRVEEDTAALVATSMGRAWNFVAKVIDCEYYHHLAERVANTRLDGFLEPIAKDDTPIVFFTERILETQTAFWNAGKPYQVDLGYQYTSEANMSRIKKTDSSPRPSVNNATFKQFTMVVPTEKVSIREIIQLISKAGLAALVFLFYDSADSALCMGRNCREES